MKKFKNRDEISFETLNVIEQQESSTIRAIYKRIEEAAANGLFSIKVPVITNREGIGRVFRVRYLFIVSLGDPISDEETLYISW